MPNLTCAIARGYWTWRQIIIRCHAELSRPCFVRLFAFAHNTITADFGTYNVRRGNVSFCSHKWKSGLKYSISIICIFSWVNGFLHNFCSRNRCERLPWVCVWRYRRLLPLLASPLQARKQLPLLPLHHAEAGAPATQQVQVIIEMDSIRMKLNYIGWQAGFSKNILRVLRLEYYRKGLNTTFFKLVHKKWNSGL